MKLPDNLAKRYTKMTPEEMSGSQEAGDLVKAAMLKGGGRPGPLKIEDQNISKAVLRPGVISWDDKRDAGVWIDARKAGGQKIASATNLNIGKILSNRYVRQDIQQGRDVVEFPKKTAPTPVQEEQTKMIAQVKEAAKAEAAIGAKVEAVKEAASVEVKATALAAKAKATKEKAMAGLAGYGLGHLGDEAAISAAAKAFADATQAALAPTCVQSGVTLPAQHCDPSLGVKMAAAGAALAEAQGKSGSKKKLIIGVAVVAAIAAGIYFYTKK